jgi:hypothetical protein
MECNPIFVSTIKKKNIMTATSNTKIFDTMFNKTYLITSVTEKRVNLDQPNAKYTTSTGRTSSKFYVGHERYENNIKSGKWIVIK